MVLFLSLPISVQIRLVNKPDIHHLIKVVLKLHVHALTQD